MLHDGRASMAARGPKPPTLNALAKVASLSCMDSHHETRCSGVKPCLTRAYSLFLFGSSQRGACVPSPWSQRPIRWLSSTDAPGFGMQGRRHDEKITCCRWWHEVSHVPWFAECVGDQLRGQHGRQEPVHLLRVRLGSTPKPCSRSVPW